MNRPFDNQIELSIMMMVNFVMMMTFVFVLVLDLI